MVAYVKKEYTYRISTGIAVTELDAVVKIWSDLPPAAAYALFITAILNNNPEVAMYVMRNANEDRILDEQPS